MPYMTRAAVILREKVIDEAGNILELAIWRVSVSAKNPEGIRYRLAYVRSGERPPAVLFDNHSPKGHHYHIQGVEGPYVFVDLDRLLADFKAAIVQVRRGR